MPSIRPMSLLIGWGTLRKLPKITVFWFATRTYDRAMRIPTRKTEKRTKTKPRRRLKKSRNVLETLN
jgi:hypothetical protein